MRNFGAVMQDDDGFFSLIFVEDARYFLTNGLKV